LQSTRSLWDPSYRDKSWIDEKIRLIPRLQELAQSLKPGLKVSLGEYNFRAEYDVSGAIAQAEILGIFARQRLDAAYYWDYPKPAGTHRYAFELFRNYNGKGLGFGDELLENTQPLSSDVSVFAARSSEDRRVTIILINKNVSKARQIKLDLGKWMGAKGLRLYSFESPKLDGKILRSDRPITMAKTITVGLKPLSMHMLELRY
jgi:hypothetical protein